MSSRRDKMASVSSTPYSLAGMLFAFLGATYAGYMSYEKLTQEMCPFDEACPMFLGRPACYFGFAMFAFMSLVSLKAYLEKRTATQTMLIASACGTAFAFFYVAEEVLGGKGIFGGRLGLSVCTWGLLMFAIILFVEYKQYKLEKEERY